MMAELTVTLPDPLKGKEMKGLCLLRLVVMLV